MLNIIGGIKKGSKIKVPKKNVRPTSNLKRAALFSIIESYGLKLNYNIYQEAIILDLFAGSGILGLEAISRGASYVYFYDNNNETILNLELNCKKVCNDNFKIIKQDILKSKFNEIKNKISIVFIDPPYEMNPFNEILNKLYESSILSNNVLIILEYSKNTSFVNPHFYNCFNERIYGKTKISFLELKNKNKQ